MKWEKRFDTQQKLFYPFLWPLIKTLGMTPFFSKRQLMKIEEIINPFLRIRNEKIIYYVRIYTNLVNAASFYEAGKVVKSKNLMRVVKGFTEHTSFPEEKSHVIKLNKLSSEIIALINNIYSIFPMPLVV